MALLPTPHRPRRPSIAPASLLHGHGGVGLPYGVPACPPRSRYEGGKANPTVTLAPWPCMMQAALNDVAQFAHVARPAVKPAAPSMVLGGKGRTAPSSTEEAAR